MQVTATGVASPEVRARITGSVPYSGSGSVLRSSERPVHADAGLQDRRELQGRGICLRTSGSSFCSVSWFSVVQLLALSEDNMRKQVQYKLVFGFPVMPTENTWAEYDRRELKKIEFRKELVRLVGGFHEAYETGFWGGLDKTGYEREEAWVITLTCEEKDAARVYERICIAAQNIPDVEWVHCVRTEVTGMHFKVRKPWPVYQGECSKRWIPVQGVRHG